MRILTVSLTEEQPAQAAVALRTSRDAQCSQCAIPEMISLLGKEFCLSVRERIAAGGLSHLILQIIFHQGIAI